MKPRITKAVLEAGVRCLARCLDLRTGTTYDEERLWLESWAPGDGWRRYRLELNGQPLFGEKWRTANNLLDCIHFAIEVHEVSNRKRSEDWCATRGHKPA